MNRSELLDEARRLVTRDREAQHGTPMSNYTLVADLWSAALSSKLSGSSPCPISVKLTAQDVMLMMVLLKAGRCMTGGSLDSWVDIAGYAALGVEMSNE